MCNSVRRDRCRWDGERTQCGDLGCCLGCCRGGRRRGDDVDDVEVAAFVCGVLEEGADYPA